MPLSRQLVEQFQKLHILKFGESIDYETAELELKNLAELVRITTSKKVSQNDKSL